MNFSDAPSSPILIVLTYPKAHLLVFIRPKDTQPEYNELYLYIKFHILPTKEMFFFGNLFQM